MRNQDWEIVKSLSTVLYKSVILFYHDQSRPVCGDCLDCVANVATSKHESKYELENNLEKNCYFFVACVITCSICFDFEKEDQEVALKKMPSKFSRSYFRTAPNAFCRFLLMGENEQFSTVYEMINWLHGIFAYNVSKTFILVWYWMHNCCVVCIEWRDSLQLTEAYA